MQSIATVRVIITDVNDNAPQFGSTFYTARFPENIGFGVEIETVKLILVEKLKLAVIYTYMEKKQANGKGGKVGEGRK